MNECDFCNADLGDPMDAWCNPLPRPSDPSEVVATLWICDACKQAMDTHDATGPCPWMRRRRVYDAVEDGRPVLGRQYLFVSV